MVRLILVRHGVTAWNKGDRFQGTRDISLSPEGKEQAHLLAERLAQEELHAIYSSDLKRAWETAARIASGRGIPITPEPRLRELDFGAWEGLTYREVEGQYPEALRRWQENGWDEAPHGGESLRQLIERVDKALREIFHKYPGQTVLIVAHGGSLQVLLCLTLNLIPKARWQFRLSPASVSELYLDERGAILTLFNDTCHLKGVR
ncbi:MAG: alpha-ribazole phosphatase [Candidatus Methylomirabilales bacterium]